MEEFRLKGCTLMVSEDESFVNILAPVLLVEGLEWPFQSIGENLGHPCPIWVPSKYFCKGFDVPKFQAIAHGRVALHLQQSSKVAIVFLH